MNEKIQIYSKNGKLDILGIIVETNFKMFVQAVNDNSSTVSCVSPIIVNELYWSFFTDFITVLKCISQLNYM